MPLSRIGESSIAGLIKMNEFVTQWGETGCLSSVSGYNGIDVGDIAEKAELLGWAILDLLHRTNRNPHDVHRLKKGTALPLYHGGPKQTIIMYLH